MSNYAIIKDNRVINVIVADQLFINKWLPMSGFDLAILQDKEKGHIGQLYKDNKFYELYTVKEDFSSQIDGNKNIFTLSKIPMKDYEIPGGKEDINVILNDKNIDFNYENNSIILSTTPQKEDILIVFYKTVREII